MRLGPLLIANRGEIAVRIARTARAMGIETVAVHSAADRGAAHVAAADRCVEIGPAPAAESYLRSDRLLEAARATGARAVHPGYGFLSENPDFAEAVLAEGLAWVGPPPAAIRAMGLKDAAKRLMEQAGVPVTPGYHGAEQDPAFLAERAAEIGYPILIKAAAGGGGKGMRRVDDPEAFSEALERARSEAAGAFANPHVLVEKFIERPRHIEVQGFADRHGNAVHLYERDCSAQRRHQKVLEEAPAPGMTDALREAMCLAAVRAALAVGYEGAGTVEFIVDGGRMTPDAFFFMEMNTRLQVEHPVTEAVTGIDLVEWQLRVAAGAPLPARQEEIRMSGHAVEVRLYAEDPSRGFVPQTGRIAALALPGDLRVEAGVRPGDTVSPHYDPMIAKLIAHGPDREAAFARLARGLGRTHLAGLVSNLAFLERLVAQPDMRAGRLDTGLIDREIAWLTEVPRPEATDLALGAAALLGLLAPGPLAGWRAWGAGWSHADLTDGAGRWTVALSTRAKGTGAAISAETPEGTVALGLEPLGGTCHAITRAGRTERIEIHQDLDGVTLARHGRRLTLRLEDPLRSAEEAAVSGDEIAAPLPGILRVLSVAPGDRVTAGAVVAVVEAMKMEHALRATRDGVVADVFAAPGQPVGEGLVLLALAPAPDASA
ncbi:MAG: acetyl/propionyl/methylcrotonyl-CoA carboxylase subunit alpha [Paracoccaceae bacterium]